MISAYERTDRDGKLLNYRTLEMLLVAERRFAAWAGLTGVEFVLTQGSWSGAAASGGTHLGGGALDIDSTSWDTAAERDRIVFELRRIGFAAWYRPRLVRADGSLVWNPHIHAIAIGDREMSAAAAQQVIWYREGLNGLWPDGGGEDTGPRVTITEYPQTLQELDMPTAQEIWAYGLEVPGTDPAKIVTAGGMLRTNYATVRKLTARVGALEGALAKLVELAADDGSTLTREEFRAAAREGAADALTAGIDIHIDVDDQEPTPAPLPDNVDQPQIPGQTAIP